MLIGATYFHNDLSNVIGFNGLFETLNLGSAITQGVETEIKVTPIPGSHVYRHLHLPGYREDFGARYLGTGGGAIAAAAPQ